MKIRWRHKLDEAEYTPARTYLTLLYGTKAAKLHVAQLKAADVEAFEAKDIFRATSLPLLADSDVHVKKDKARIRKEKRLCPILMVRDPENGRIVVADGYHRLCAVYSVDVDALICCKIC